MKTFIASLLSLQSFSRRDSIKLNGKLDYLNQNKNLTIQSLRAIAVLGVVLCHYQISIFKGGYLGVDIFFTISGYVITLMILKDIENKNFSIKNFYLRRFRRLVPTFLLVIIISSIASWFILYPSQIIEFSKSIISNLLFISNFFFWSVGTEYGAESNTLKPLLHTWSLSVEAQFYLFISIFFLFYNYFSEKKILLFILFIIVFNIICATEINKIYSKFNFFFTATRAWEFLLGTLVAILQQKNFLKINISNTILEFLVFLSLGTILWSYIYLDYELDHPSYQTLVVIIPSIFLILMNSKNLISLNLLNNKFFIFVGTISYSLYLWHYPLISFSINLSIDNNNLKLILIFILFIISYLSFNYIEQPFRDKKYTPTKIYILFTFSLVTLSIIFTFLILYNDGFKNRFKLLNSAFGNNEFDNAILRKESYLEYNNFVNSFDGYSSRDAYKFQYEKETFSENNKTNKVLIIGNSHSLATWNSFYLNKEIFENFEFARVLEEIHKFGSNKEVIKKFINSPNFKKSNIILVSSSFRIEKDKNINYLDGLKKLNQIASENQKELIVTIPFYWNYVDNELPSDYLLKNNINFEYSKNKLEEFNKYCFSKKSSKYKNEIIEFGIEKKVKILDKADYICDTKSKICNCFDDVGIKTYYDGGHQSLSGAKYFGKIIFEKNWLQIYDR